MQLGHSCFYSLPTQFKCAGRGQASYFRDYRDDYFHDHGNSRVPGGVWLQRSNNHYYNNYHQPNTFVDNKF